MMKFKSIEEIDSEISQLNAYYFTENGKRNKIKEYVNDYEKELVDIEEKLILLEKVNVLLQKTSEHAREQSKIQIENLVTNCLQYVFDSNIEFKIEIEESHSKPIADFFVISKDDDIIIKTKPELSRGGGIVDVVSLALRIAFLQIHKPLVEGPIILDEPAKHVSEDYIFNVADFLKQVSEMFNRQIILVTHNNHLSAISTTAYRVELKEHQSIVSKVT